MEKSVPIAAIVSKSRVSVTPQDRLSSVYQQMKKLQLAHIPVTDRDRIVGIISRRDLLHLGFGYQYEGRSDVELGMFDMLQADQVMVRNPPRVTPESTVAEVAELLATKELPALPVVDTGGAVVGTININAIVLFLLK